MKSPFWDVAPAKILNNFCCGCRFAKFLFFSPLFRWLFFFCSLTWSTFRIYLFISFFSFLLSVCTATVHTCMYTLLYYSLFTHTHTCTRGHSRTHRTGRPTDTEKNILLDDTEFTFFSCCRINSPFTGKYSGFAFYFDINWVSSMAIFYVICFRRFRNQQLNFISFIYSLVSRVNHCLFVTALSDHRSMAK